MAVFTLAPMSSPRSTTAPGMPRTVIDAQT